MDFPIIQLGEYKMQETYGLDDKDRFTKDKDGNTIVVGKVGDEKQEEKSLGNRLKFKLEFMMMMLLAGRKDEASKMYDQLVAEFDKLA
jgi:hypothetical protein|tara:strand:- start:2092 stop:2355 length:264 start_codon:yes stop_codon:yes gene_type:complete